jgi:hypothetical protein
VIINHSPTKGEEEKSPVEQYVLLKELYSQVQSKTNFLEAKINTGQNIDLVHLDQDYDQMSV